MGDFDDSEPSTPPPPRSAYLLDHFSVFSGPRLRWWVLDPLREILLPVLCATLSGTADFVEIRLSGAERPKRRSPDQTDRAEAWVSRCLRLAAKHVLENQGSCDLPW